MTYEEAREFIKEAGSYGLAPGLDTITELLKRLGDPQNKLKVIHVAGTNGKGSVCAFISTIMAEAGYRVGRYLSPAVNSYREIIQIYRLGGRSQTSIDYITKNGVADAIGRIKPICEEMVKEGLKHPTYFEIETAMAFLYLSREKVDYAVIEVGLGGRLDATNVIKKPVCSVITSISMDHMKYLGDTLEKIAAEKAGIIKEGCPVITCDQEPEVISVIKQKAEELSAPLIVADSKNARNIRYSVEGTDFTVNIGHVTHEYNIKLLGEYQVKNAVLAVQAVNDIKIQNGLGIWDDMIKKGLSQTKWSGRFEILSRRPYFIIDGAHNEDAARTLRRSIEIYFTNQKIIYIIGVLADKDYRSILEITAPLADVIITLTPDNSRALSSDKLAQEALKYCDKVIDAGNAKEAVKLAYSEACAKDVIIAFGSLSYLGELAGVLDIRKDED